ncbi:hypothetical protein [Paraliomyxa miuraensis]|uniref:hypothetical protein n=1 Tax=Paraliomyxa miuraensis TaxID=376150 RepID=UPI00225853BA|nr:hypothetical protein [Paraliomyxa miuraensis]MCX4244377.1 hypothetical protein [Paraliomyxa miuraensis]
MIVNLQLAAENYRPILLIVLAAAVASGCGAPSSPDIPPVGSAGTDGDTGGDDEPGPGQCIIEANDGGLVGESYQCKGQFHAYFGADGAEESSYAVSFGYPDSGDSYEKPFVAACCGPLVEAPNCPDGDVNQHLWACYVDAVQQMCVGLGTKVEEVRNEVPPAHALIKPSLAQLRDWLNLSTSILECTDTFILHTGLISFDCTEDPSSLIEDVTWSLSETKHGLIHNPYVRIGHVEVVDVDKPEVGESCVNLHDNDTHIPLEIGPQEPGWTKLILADGTVNLTGPELDGIAVTGSAGLASMATGCQGKGCSSLSANLQTEPGQWRLEGLQLHSVGAASVASGSASVGVEEYTISLFSPVDGIAEGSTYEIPPGAALFSLSGHTAFGNYSLATTNTTTIVLQASESGWVMPPFGIGYVDQDGNDWTLTIDAAAWASPPPQSGDQ